MYYYFLVLCVFAVIASGVVVCSRNLSLRLSSLILSFLIMSVTAMSYLSEYAALILIFSFLCAVLPIFAFLISITEQNFADKRLTISFDEILGMMMSAYLATLLSISVVEKAFLSGFSNIAKTMNIKTLTSVDAGIYSGYSVTTLLVAICFFFAIVSSTYMIRESGKSHLLENAKDDSN